jgi:hypothetical protein
MRLSAALLLLAGLPSPLTAQAVDTAGAGQLVAEALQNSQLMSNLEYLSYHIGPRLSGSPEARRANDWVAERMRAYGLEAHLEPYSFGVTWERGPAQVWLTAPFRRRVVAWSWAWTEGTRGMTLRGPVIRLNLPDRDSIETYRGRLKGVWVMLNDPASLWNPDGPPMTAADSAARQEQMSRRRELVRQQNADTSRAAVDARMQFLTDRPYLLRKYGALGTIFDGAKEQALMTMSGSPTRISPLPNLVVSHEDYLMFDRLASEGSPARLEAKVANRLGKRPVTQWNTISEIRGTEWPGEVVIVGAHLDSWDLGQGTTDNGTGSMAVLETARVISATGLKPRRTIRFILFTGEEEGLLGSRAYAAGHAAEADSIQAVLVLDNGTGMITGQALQGWDELEQLWKELLVPVDSLGAVGVRQGFKGGTDHLSFIPYGVPGFNFDQNSRGYNHTHHSQSDTYDKAVEGDLKQAAAVLAVTAMELANLPTRLPHHQRTPVPPLPPARPSLDLAR